MAACRFGDDLAGSARHTQPSSVVSGPRPERAAASWWLWAFRIDVDVLLAGGHLLGALERRRPSSPAGRIWCSTRQRPLVTGMTSG